MLYYNRKLETKLQENRQLQIKSLLQQEITKVIRRTVHVML